MKDAEELSRLSLAELEIYVEQNQHNPEILELCLEATLLQLVDFYRKGERRRHSLLRRKIQNLKIDALHRQFVEREHNNDAQTKRLERLKQSSAYELEDAHFTYQDGSKDSTSYEICLAQRATEYVPRNPEAGKIYFENGFKLLCVHPYASYGGGAATLWAIEGVSAQLTLHSIRSGYIRGKCLKIHKNPLGITFQAWAWPNADGVMQQNDSAPRFLEFDDIKRYDTNWW